ncbi:MAG TPA: hypothetical protein VNZ47_10300 [Candidatus Dormibacteraeota bacterium]|jgi:ElaB/YqjD/DUF883 family membrane-anchored ribosome-binding protein|nr:hypothetical protein [Candidatus Dormibacteraeota bacterium]
MAERMHNSSDVPNFDTYPASPSDELIDYKGVEKSSLEQRAAELGAAAGRIAVIMRQTKEGMENLAQHEIYDRVTNLAENAKARTEQIRRMAADRVQEIAHAAQDKAAEFGHQARERTVELGRQARTNYFRARLKANQTVREYPVQTALAAGVVGLLAGVALRIGRAKRAY